MRHITSDSLVLLISIVLTPLHFLILCYTNGDRVVNLVSSPEVITLSKVY